MKKDREVRQQVAKAFADTASVKDSATVAAGVKAIMDKRAKEKYRRDHQKIWNRNTGKPMAKGEFMRWTDISTSRWQTAVENLFGESLQLHEDYVLGDVLRNRPVMLFDEATSALDTDTEAQLLRNILAEKNKTVIFITHRPAVLQHCSQIITVAASCGWRCRSSLSTCCSTWVWALASTKSIS